MPHEHAGPSAGGSPAAERPPVPARVAADPHQPVGEDRPPPPRRSPKSQAPWSASAATGALDIASASRMSSSTFTTTLRATRARRPGPARALVRGREHPRLRELVHAKHADGDVARGHEQLAVAVANALAAGGHVREVPAEDLPPLLEVREEDVVGVEHPGLRPGGRHAHAEQPGRRQHAVDLVETSYGLRKCSRSDDASISSAEPSSNGSERTSATTSTVGSCHASTLTKPGSGRFPEPRFNRNGAACAFTKAPRILTRAPSSSPPRSGSRESVARAACPARRAAPGAHRPSAAP